MTCLQHAQFGPWKQFRKLFGATGRDSTGDDAGVPKTQSSVATGFFVRRPTSSMWTTERKQCGGRKILLLHACIRSDH